MWNTLWPDGSKSVKGNTTPGQQNTTYIKTTQNVDHYWDIGSNEDGHHRQVQMEAKASDLTLDTGMDGGIYLKEIGGTVQGFYRNASNIYQFIPGFKSGTASMSGSFTNVDTVPNAVYGQIWMFRQAAGGVGGQDVSFGWFRSFDNIVQVYGPPSRIGNSSSDTYTLIYANSDQVSGLNIRAKTSSGASGTYQYRIIYWGV